MSFFNKCIENFSCLELLGYKKQVKSFRWLKGVLIFKGRVIKYIYESFIFKASWSSLNTFLSLAHKF